MQFDKAFDKLVGHEGGYVNDSRDPGGETNWGISKRSYPGEDIKGMDRERAKEIYLRDFWQPFADRDSVPPTLLFHMFDAAVNQGPKMAVVFLQRAAGMPPEQQDGAWGPKTDKAIRWVPHEKIVEWYNGHRLKHYTDLATWPAFGKGWARRVALNLLVED